MLPPPAQSKSKSKSDRDANGANRSAAGINVNVSVMLKLKLMRCLLLLPRAGQWRAVLGNCRLRRKMPGHARGAGAVEMKRELCVPGARLPGR